MRSAPYLFVLALGALLVAAAAETLAAPEEEIRATVELPRGELTILWAGPPERLWMTGPATLAYEGTTATI